MTLDMETLTAVGACTGLVAGGASLWNARTSFSILEAASMQLPGRVRRNA